MIWVVSGYPRFSESRRDEMWVSFETKYPHFVPTGLRETPAPVFSTHISSLRDRGKQRPRCFLPTFRPYGTTRNTGVGVSYPHSVPTGLREIPGLVFSTSKNHDRISFFCWGDSHSRKKKIPKTSQKTLFSPPKPVEKIALK